MKKIYNAPDTILKTVRSEKKLLAGSNPEIKWNPNEDVVDAGGVDARENNNAWQTPRSLWDE